LFTSCYYFSDIDCRVVTFTRKKVRHLFVVERVSMSW